MATTAKPEPIRAVRWGLSLALAGVVSVAAWLMWAATDEPAADFTVIRPPSGEPALAAAQSAIGTEVVPLDSLGTKAAAAVGGYALAGAEVTVVDGVAAWSLDLTGDDVTADRVALGLLELGWPFERTGDDWNTLEGDGALPGVDALVGLAEADRIAAVAAVVETTGTPTGRVFVGAADRADVVAALFASLDMEVERSVRAEGVELTLPRLGDRERVAGWAYVCADRVPIIGGRGCGGGVDRLGPAEIIDTSDTSAWLVATTGSLVPGAPPDPPSSEGGIGWTNREAQTYAPEAVTAADGALVLTATPKPTPSVDELPYQSGMVIGREQLGLGRLDVDVAVPAGDGLWPAVWLLDAEACEVPGRCPLYASNAYHEIDVLETNGADPDQAFFSLHWWDEQLRSTSGDQAVPGLSSGSMRRVSIDRRPGLLQWYVDGELVRTVAGPVAADRGPHRVAPMHLIINLAVGGVFAGDLQIGRNGQWWGDARVPGSFPDVGWNEARLVVGGVEFSPLG